MIGVGERKEVNVDNKVRRYGSVMDDSTILCSKSLPNVTSKQTQILSNLPGSSYRQTQVKSIKDDGRYQ